MYENNFINKIYITCFLIVYCKQSRKKHFYEDENEAISFQKFFFLKIFVISSINLIIRKNKIISKLKREINRNYFSIRFSLYAYRCIQSILNLNCSIWYTHLFSKLLSLFCIN